MTETEQQRLPPSLQPAACSQADIAQGIAKHAQENLPGLDVVSVGTVLPEEGKGETHYIPCRPPQ